MLTLILALKVVGVVVLAFEALLVVAMIYLAVDYVRENFGQKDNGKHRAPEGSPLERAKQLLREQKEKEAKENAFWSEYWMQGFYNADEQARRDDQVMSVLTSEEI